MCERKPETVNRQELTMKRQEISVFISAKMNRNGFGQINRTNN